MTQQCDVLVIGGGLLGCAAAWMLAQDGASVVLVERDQINAHASGQNAGSLHFQLEYRMIEQGLEAARRAAEALPLHLDAARRWADLGRELPDTIDVSQNGGLMLAETIEQEDLLGAKAELERSWGLDVDVVDGPELRTLAPYLSESVIAAAHCPSEGKANTRTAGPAMAREASRHGAHVLTRTRVTALERSGRFWNVTTEHTDEHGNVNERRFVSGSIILAAGIWTSELGDLVGAHLPTIAVALMLSVTSKTQPFLPHLLQHAGKKLSLKQASDGNVLIGGGWPARLHSASNGQPMLDLPPELITRSLAGNAQAALSVVPQVGDLPVLRSWVGTTTITPDQLPLVGPIAGQPGAYVATGGSAFTLGLTFAHVLCELIQGRKPSLDLSPYAPNRYGGQ